MAAPLPNKPAPPRAASSLTDADSSAPADPRKRQTQAEHARLAQEIDVWWGSYAGRAMLPGFLLCGLLTVFLLALDWYLQTGKRRSDMMSSAVLGLVGAIWLFQGTRWVYRMIAVNYRLTNRRLLYMRGFKLPDCWAVELARVTDVSVLRGPLERLLGLGRIQIKVHGVRLPSVVLEGVRAPERIARIIRRRVRQARARG